MERRVPRGSGKSFSAKVSAFHHEARILRQIPFGYRLFDPANMSASDSATSSRKAVGIDLGTTFCAIAPIDAYGKPQIIPNSESERITPSVILFDGTNAIVGTLAKQNAVAEPEKIVDFVKREMGRSKGQFHREFNGKIYSAEELSALIIKKLKNEAEKYLGEPVTDAVITV